MPTFSTAQRLKIALGGFVSFTGLAILACTILTLTGAANLASIFQDAVSAIIVTIVGGLDVACGLLLVFRNKEIVLSFTAHQEKPNENTD